MLTEEQIKRLTKHVNTLKTEFDIVKTAADKASGIAATWVQGVPAPESSQTVDPLSPHFDPWHGQTDKDGTGGLPGHAGTPAGPPMGPGPSQSGPALQPASGGQGAVSHGSTSVSPSAARVTWASRPFEDKVALDSTYQWDGSDKGGEH